MKVLVDTSAWSQALRRRSGTEGDGTASALADLVRDLRVAIIGPIRQELLSGIPDPAAFEGLRSRLRAFPDEALDSGDYELAATFYNACRKKGIQGSHTDFLICAAAVARRMAIYTLDRDFLSYRKVIPVNLFTPT